MKRLLSSDTGAWLGLLLLGSIYAGWKVDFQAAPFEDAAILMRYARHLAQGFGIVWNIGEAPLDGGTDFLYLVMLAGFYKLGFSMETAVSVLGILSHFAGGSLLFWTLRRQQSAPLFWSVTATAYWLLGPGLWLTAAYFGTSFFALFLMLSWAMSLEMIQVKVSNRKLWLLGLVLLTTGLIRPEGVLLGGLMVLAILWQGNRATNQGLLIRYGLVFGLLGGGYFFWHWGYFGAPLPHPFYKKGGGSFYPWSLYTAILGTLKMCWPFILAFLWGIFSSQWKQVLRLSIPLIGGVLMWGLLSDEMNFGFRFQYPLMGLFAMSSFLVFPKGVLEKVEIRFPLAITLALLVLWQGWSAGSIRNYPDGRYYLAKSFQPYAEKGYRLATTEAGLLPYYSEWISLDAWGLNDRRVVEEGKLTLAHLEEWKPDLILFHGDMNKYGPLSHSEHNAAWMEMNDTLQQYAEQQQFTLAAAYGTSPYFVHFYYVSPWIADHDSLVALIRRQAYPWFTNRLPSWDFREEVVPNQSEPPE